MLLNLQFQNVKLFNRSQNLHFFSDNTLIWRASFESDFQDKKNGTNLFFLPQKMTKLVHVNARFKQQFLSWLFQLK